MEKKNTFVQNFARFTANDGGDGVIKIITDAAGNETGFEVRGKLTQFNVRNENGLSFSRESYDHFVDEYYGKNKLNVPLNIKHKDDDFQHVAGKVVSMTKTDDGVEMVAYVPRWVYAYNWIKQAVTDGVLQGFSNAGAVIDAEYDEKSDTLNIKDFALMHVALVEIPADVSAKFQAQNTAFSGFGNDGTVEVENKKEEEKKIDDWRILV